MSTTDSHQHMMGRNGTISECPKGSILDNTSVKVIFCALYILTFLLAFFGNLFTIIIIGINHKMRTATNFFLVNLAVADLLIAIFCIIQNMYHIIARSFGDWPFGDLPCKTYVYVLHLVPCTSIGILTCVSIEKYIAVLHPLKALHLLTPRMRGSIMVGIWTFSIFTNLPYFLTTNEVQFEKMSACTRNFDAGIDIKDMITISFIIWYCVPLCVLVFIYSRIGQRLWQSEISRFKEKNKNHEGELIRLHDIDSNGAISINLNSSPESSPMHSNGRNAFGKVMFRIKKTTETITDPLTDFFHRGAIVFGKQEQQSGNESRKKILILLVGIVSSFSFLTLPHHIRLLILMHSKNHSCTTTFKALAQPLAYLMLFLSSGVNPILYAFMSKRFREAVTSLVKCRFINFHKKRNNFNSTSSNGVENTFLETTMTSIRRTGSCRSTRK